MAKANRIAPDIKAQILRRIKVDGIPVAQVARDHGVHDSTIYGWLSASVQGASPTWQEVRALKKENALLTTIVGEMALQVSLSKKNR